MYIKNTEKYLLLVVSHQISIILTKGNINNAQRIKKEYKLFANSLDYSGIDFSVVIGHRITKHILEYLATSTQRRHLTQYRGYNSHQHLYQHNNGPSDSER